MTDRPENRRRVLHRWRRVWAVLVLGVVAVAGLDVVLAVGDHGDHLVLAAVTKRLVATRAEIGATRARITDADTQRAERQSAIDETEQEIATTESDLHQAEATGSLQQVDIATLTLCLDGVSTAQSDLTAGNLPGAVTAITSVSAACLTVEGTSNGLAYPFDFPDPFVLVAQNQYYAFATNAAAGNIQIIQSSDLQHWTTIGDALPQLPPWAVPARTWAPAVLALGTTDVLYYTADDAALNEQCLSVATADAPQGPYVDTSSAPLVCQAGGSIDPSPFVDTDGTPYLIWKSQGGGGQPPTIWSQQLQPDGTSFAPGSPTALLEPDQNWEHGYLEAPDLVSVGGRDVLLYSGSDWKTDTYAVGAADCSGPLGPCADVSSQPMLSSGPGIAGPGGEDVFADASGQLWIAFDAWLPGEVGEPHSRPLFLRRLDVTNGVPAVVP